MDNMAAELVRRRCAPERLHLPDDARRVEPRLLATDEPVADIEHVQDPEPNRRAPSVDADERAMDMTRGDRLVHDMIAALEPSRGLQVDVGHGGHDPLVDLGRRALPEDGTDRVADVVPHQVVGVGGERGLHVGRILGREVPLDDVHDRLPPAGVPEHSRAASRHDPARMTWANEIAAGYDGGRSSGWIGGPRWIPGTKRERTLSRYATYSGNRCSS